MSTVAPIRPVIPGLGRDQSTPQRVTVQIRQALVVDEALPIRRKLLDILHRTGIAAGDVLMAENAQEALDAFAKHHPSLVMCELVGKPEDGLEMVLEMLTLDPHAKIVLVTSEASESPLVRAAIRAGVFAIVRKPLRFEAIRQVLSEIESEEGGIERFR